MATQEELLRRLEDRLILGEITKEVYEELKVIILARKDELAGGAASSISDSVIRGNVNTTTGAASVGNVIVNVPDSSRTALNTEVEYETFVLTVLRAGGRLEGARADLESRRQKLGLSLRVAQDIEAACYRAVAPAPKARAMPGGPGIFARVLALLSATAGRIGRFFARLMAPKARPPVTPGPVASPLPALPPAPPPVTGFGPPIAGPFPPRPVPIPCLSIISSAPPKKPAAAIPSGPLGLTSVEPVGVWRWVFSFFIPQRLIDQADRELHDHVQGRLKSSALDSPNFQTAEGQAILARLKKSGGSGRAMSSMLPAAIAGLAIVYLIICAATGPSGVGFMDSLGHTLSVAHSLGLSPPSEAEFSRFRDRSGYVGYGQHEFLAGTSAPEISGSDYWDTTAEARRRGLYEFVWNNTGEVTAWRPRHALMRVAYMSVPGPWATEGVVFYLVFVVTFAVFPAIFFVRHALRLRRHLLAEVEAAALASGDPGLRTRLMPSVANARIILIVAAVALAVTQLYRFAAPLAIVQVRRHKAWETREGVDAAFAGGAAAVSSARQAATSPAV